MMARAKPLAFSLLYLTFGFILELPQISAASPSSSSPCEIKHECNVQRNAANARVRHPATSYGTYSCVTNNATDKEVHVVGVYEGYGGQRNFRELPTVMGKIKLHVTRLPSSAALPVVLVLLSYEAVMWEITTDEGIHIQEVNVLSYYADQSSVVLDQSPAPAIIKERQYNGYGKRPQRRATLLAHVAGHYGLMTSLTGVYSVNSPATWTLNTGIQTTCEDDLDISDISPDPTPSSPCNTTSEECRVDKNAVSARVSHPATVFPTYSCVTRNAKDKEVHIINTYEGFGSQRNINELPTVVGKIKLHVTRLPSSAAIPVVLVLTSYEAINWHITKDAGIHIKEVNVLSSFAEQSGVILNQTPAATIRQERRYFGFGRRSHRRNKILAFARGRYGLVTSFTWVFSVNSSDTWNLATGISGTCHDNYDFISDACSGEFDGYYPNPRNCSRFVKCEGGTVHPMVCETNTRWSQARLACLASAEVECVQSTASPPNDPMGEVEFCLRSQRCWVEHKFRYDNLWNECSGKQYISRTQHPEAPFLGVVLCNNNRYKLFLSSAPWEEFLNIADSSGHGADHCELVGGTEGKASLPTNYWDSPVTIGYYRHHWGDSFQKGPIGHGPRNGSEWTGRLYTTWYQCGVQIPGNFRVLPASDMARPTTTSSSTTPRTTVETSEAPPSTTIPDTHTPDTSDNTTGGAEDPHLAIAFVRRPRNVTGVVGKRNVYLQCKTSVQSDIIWRRNGAALSVGPSQQFPGLIVYLGGVLRITSLHLIHQARYTCEAALPDNHDVYIRTDAWITVNPVPTTPAPTCGIEFTSEPEDIETVDGDFNGIHLSCTTNPSQGVSLRWLKNGKPIDRVDDEVEIFVNNDLFIGEVSLAHAGEYTCEAQRDNDTCKTRSSGMLRVQHTSNLSHVCGRPSVQPLSVSGRGLISGGSDARRRAEPWIAHLCHEDPEAGCFCGGVLISSRYVLTAAHCLDTFQHKLFREKGFSVNRWTLIIKLGSYDQFDDEEEGQLIVRPDQRFVMHQQYDSETFDNDIALIHIDRHVPFNDQILPVCLESKGFIHRHFHSIRNNHGVVSGWGVLGTGGQPQFLQEVELPLHSHATCKNATRYDVTKNMFCAGYTSSVVEGSACKGDSGGPFIMKHENVWYLVGLVSWGDPTQRCDRMYGYYTKMANYYTWVVDEVGVLE